MAYRIGEGPYKYRVTFRAIGTRGGKEYRNVELHRRKNEYELRALALGWTVENVEVLS
jgi:hypothetical protein